VLATITMSGPSSTSMSADDPIWTEASDACNERATELLGDSADLGDIVLYAPHPDEYAGGGRTAYCTFFTSGGLFTGSAVEHSLTQSSTGSST